MVGDSVKSFCYTASYRIMAGLRQELGLEPGRHYLPKGHNAARVMSLKLAGINPHYLTSIVGLRDQLTMWAGLDDKSRVRIGWVGTNIILEIPKPTPFWRQVTLDTLERRRMMRRGPVVTLGLGLQDDPKRINFREGAIAHVLISGQTRSGKTNAQKLVGWNIVHNTDPADAQLLIFDVAKRGFKWRDFGHVIHLAHPVITSVEEADQVLAWLSNEIERRAEQRYTTPRIFCLIDELKALTDDSQLAASYLARIASVGGEFGLHLILATQYPQVKLLGGSSELKRNVSTRLCGRVDDAAAAANALGLANSGAEGLQGYGDFLLKDFDGLSRLTVAKIDDHHIEKLPRAEAKYLDLPHHDLANRGPLPAKRGGPDYLQPEEIGPVLFQWGAQPTGINKIQTQAGGVGSKKARRIQRFIIDLIQLAQENGVETIEFNQLGVN